MCDVVNINNDIKVCNITNVIALSLSKGDELLIDNKIYKVITKQIELKSNNTGKTHIVTDTTVYVGGVNE